MEKSTKKKLRKKQKEVVAKITKEELKFFYRMHKNTS
jgi:hypothetical protein